MAILDTNKFASTSALRTAPTVALGMVVRVFKEIADRAALRNELSGLSERDLRDIGMTDTDRASLENLPLNTDSATKLSVTRARQMKNW